MNTNRHINVELIDVVCSVFNHAEYIEECIDSILAQRNVRVKIHLVDDASTDGSLDIASKYLVSNPEQIIIYANPINIGDSVRAIDSNKISLTAKYWTYIEGDDFLLNPDKFYLQIKELNQNSELIGTATQCLFWDVKSGEKTVLKPDVNKFNYVDLVLRKNQYSMYCHISSIVWKAESRGGSIKIYSEEFINEYSNSEVLYVHYVLKKSRKYLKFQNIEGSCYRYTGNGIWSKLSVSEQLERNEQLQREIDSMTPWWLHVYLNIKKWKSCLGKKF